MPPLAALLICGVFIAYLVRNERNEAPSVSGAIWIPAIWLMIVSTKSVSQWVAGSNTGDSDIGNLPDQIFVLVWLLIGVIILANRSTGWKHALRTQSPIVLLFVLMFCSILWSSIPAETFGRLIRQLLALCMALVVASEKSPTLAVESILRRATYILIPTSILLIKYYPHLGVDFGRWSGERMWVGVALQKNGLGRVCMVSLLFMIWSYFKSRRFGHENGNGNKLIKYCKGIVFVLAAYMLLFPDGKVSATSLVALFAGLATMWLMFTLSRDGRTLKISLIATSVLFLFLLGISLPLSGGTVATGFNAMLDRDATFTGRADTWAEIIPIAFSHPILGCGFDSYWTPATRELHAMSHGHSSYLEMFNELGIVGLIAYFSVFLSVAKHGRNELLRNREWGVFAVSYLVMSMAHGATESSINSFSGQLLGTLLLISFSLSNTPDRH